MFVTKKRKTVKIWNLGRGVKAVPNLSVPAFNGAGEALVKSTTGALGFSFVAVSMSLKSSDVRKGKA